MMRKLVQAAVLVSAVWWLVEQPLLAQVPGTRPTPPTTIPFYRPPVSPYLNLLRGGRLGPTIGYFNQTRPQLQFGNQLQQLQSSVLDLQQQAGLPEEQTTTPVQPGLTGHPVRYFSYAPYYTSSQARTPVRAPPR